ncbi:MAG: lysophospholipase [Lachnospiraceae bacterium]|nr:lysophospholipase [Lachnospiraceae bacterium]
MAEREEFYYDSRDEKHRIRALRWTGDGEILCILQIVHGMAEHIERYDAFASYMADHGILVVANDHLGHGKSIADKSEYGYFCEKDPLTVVVHDIHRLKKLTQEAYPGKPYFILGHSMGSLLLRNYLFRYGNGINGAVLTGTASQPALMTKPGLLLLRLIKLFKGEKYRSKLASKLVNGDCNGRIPDKRTEFDWLCKDEAIVDRYIADEACGYLFTLNGYLTLVKSVDRLNDKKLLSEMPKNLPVLFLSGEEDPVGNYGAGVKRAYQQFLDAGMKETEMKLYPGLRHEILNEACKEDIYEEILAYLKKHI